MDREWKLGEDIHELDNLLDGFTFDCVITALYCGEKVIDEAAVNRVVKDILDSQIQDMRFLIENNMHEIIKRAKRERSE